MNDNLKTIKEVADELGVSKRKSRTNSHISKKKEIL